MSALGATALETEAGVRALFLLAGFKVGRVWRLENKYWPDAYVELRQKNPWWLLETEAGLVEIGWRKRVISIDWSAGPVRAVVTEDEVTKGDDHVHAYGIGKALEHLTRLRAATVPL